jgi:hypothetical protein
LIKYTHDYETTLGVSFFLVLDVERLFLVVLFAEEVGLLLFVVVFLLRAILLILTLPTYVAIFALMVCVFSQNKHHYDKSKGYMSGKFVILLIVLIPLFLKSALVSLI